MIHQLTFLVSFITLLSIITAAFAAPDAGRSVIATATQGRAPALSAIDGAYYNPAGLPFMKEGLHLDAGYQLLAKTTAVEMLHSNAEDNRSSWFVPNFALAYVRKNRGAVFLSLCMPEGVESFEYRRNRGGMPFLAWYSLGLDAVQMGSMRALGLTVDVGGLELPAITYMKSRRWWLQGRVGGSFAITDMVSVTGGIACSYFEGERSAGVGSLGTVDKFESKGVGWSGFFGLALGPPEKAALSLLYSTQVIARGKEKNVKYHYTRAAEHRRPDSLMIGFHVRTGDGAAVLVSYTVEFTGERRFGSDRTPAVGRELGYLDWLTVAMNASAWAVLPILRAGNSENYKHRHRHSAAVGLELDMGQFAPLIGLSYTSQEKYPRVQNPLDPDLVRIGLGAGLRIRAGDGVVIETGTAYYFFVTDRMLLNSVKMNKTAWVWGVNVSARVL